MLSYAVVDRDRERLVEDLDIARQFQATPTLPKRRGRHQWLRHSLTRHSVRTHLAGI